MKRPWLSISFAFSLAAGAATVHAQTNSVSLKLDDETSNMLRGLAAYIQTNSFSIKPDEETRKLLRGITEDKWFKKENFASTVLGGALAIAGGLVVSLSAHLLQARQKKRQDAEFSSNVLRAIRREVEVFMETFEKGIGGALARTADGQILKANLASTENYFTVFESSLVHFGKVGGPISTRLITVYHLSKGIMGQLRNNNIFLEELRSLETGRPELQHFQSSQDQQSQVNEVKGRMVKHCRLLKDKAKAQKAEVETLFQSLDEIGIR